MKFKIFILFISMVWYGWNSHAQSKRYEDPETFNTDMRNMMNRTKVPLAQEIGQAFDSLYNDGTFSENQKIQLTKIGTQMSAKSCQARPHFQDFLSTLVYAKTIEGMSSDEIANLLEISLKTVENYKVKEIENYFYTLKTLFSHQALYHSSFYKLYIQNADYYLEYVEPFVEEVIQPEAAMDEASENEEDSWFDDWEEDSDDDWSGNLEEESVDLEDPVENPLYTEVSQPTLEGPVIIFGSVDLNFSTSFDSTFLAKTSGTLMLKNQIFVGSGGKFDWSVAGLSTDSVYCSMDKYNFNIIRPKISAENVSMTYKGKLDNPVKGVFDFESKRHESPQKSKFPRFKSYKNNVKVNLAQNNELIYHGGFSLEGAKVSSSSLYDGFADIEMKREGISRFKSKAKRFIISDSTIEASIASVVIYQGSDSIMHPAIRINYNYQNQHLVVLKDQGRYKYAPFYTSYFNMDVTADMIRWDINADSIDISILNARNQIPVYFESQEYFNPDRFGEMAGLYKFHPLFLVVGYARKVNSSEFLVDDIIKFSKQSPEVVRSAMEFLMSYHFIDYNSITGLIKLRRKAYHNVLSKNRRKDFDNLLIASVINNKPNATYHLKENEMTVRGVQKFYISELLDVFIVPDSSTIRLKKNRDFTFDGKLFAGNFEYIGKDFTFRYDSFLVDMKVIDSVRFYVPNEEEEGGKTRLDNKIVGETKNAGDPLASAGMTRTSGTLFINKPNNKSARKVYPGYPTFDAKNGAIVYFKGEEILGGAYSDMSLYFIIPPFKMDSLSESDIGKVGFEGTFMSSGLLPEFKEKLVIMPDRSLGFVHRAPLDGYGIRGGKGKFYNTLTMDKNGLRGNGRIEYLNTTIDSEDFIFYNDSIITEGEQIKMETRTIGNAFFPEAIVGRYKMKWVPAKDSMYLHNIGDKIQLYESTASLDGYLNITPKGVLGGGQLETRGSVAISQELAFLSDRYSARHAEFEIKSDNEEKPALKGDDIRLEFNLENNFADISPEQEGIAAIDFPYAQMKTSITKAKWNLDDRTVIMTKPDDVDISSSYFYSTRKELDSLAFNASEARYDINSLQLHVGGIPHIKIADAFVTPDNHELTILENSELQPMENATLVIDTLNQYHNLSKGNITIVSRNEFFGDATYDLVAASDTFGIKLDSFELEPLGEGKRGKKLQTVSRGNIEEIDRIMVSPKMIFKGTVNMFATKQALELDGFVKLDLQKIAGYDTWIQYKSISDTQQVIIEYNSIVTRDGSLPSSGLHFEVGDFNLYPNLVSERRSLGDEDFFTPSGFLQYDENIQAFKIEDLNKTTGKSFAGKSFTFDEDSTRVTFEGPLNFLSPGSSQTLLMAAGKGEGDFNTNEYTINAFLAYGFEFPSQAANSMAADIQDLIERIGIPEAHEDKTKLLYKAAEIIGNKAANNYDEKSQNDYVSLVSMSNELVKPLVISDVNLKWSDTDKAFYNPLDSKIGVSNIGKNDINAKLEGFIEIRKTENGDILNVFLKASSVWYYMSYTDNLLVLYSNNDEFNEIVKSKTNVDKAKIGEYIFVPGELNEVQKFVDEFRKVYYDIDDPFVLDQPTDVVAEEPPLINETDTPANNISDDDDDGF